MLPQLQMILWKYEEEGIFQKEWFMIRQKEIIIEPMQGLIHLPVNMFMKMEFTYQRQY